MDNSPQLELLAFRRALHMRENIFYLKAWKNNLTVKLDNEIITRMNNGLNWIIEIVGETGSGKSEVGFNINFKCQKALKYKELVKDNYAFSYTEATTLAQKYDNRWTIQVDEQVRNNFGQGAKRELSALQDLEDTQRADQLNFIFVSPTSRPFHTSLHYIIRTWWIDYEKKINYCLVFEPDDIKLQRPLGYIEVKRQNTKEYMKFLNEYWGYKGDFNKSVRNKSTRVLYYEQKSQDAKEIAELLQNEEIGFKTKKSLLAYITLNLSEYASKYGIAELNNIAEMVLIILNM